MEFRGEEDQELTTPQLSLQLSGVERMEDGQKTIANFFVRSERAPSTKHDLVSPYTFPKWRPSLRAPKVECEIPDNSWKCPDCRHQVNLLDPTHGTLV